jgi:hypothetical protein
VGEHVLLKLQPYAQSSMVNRHFPKLAFKYFGPYEVPEKLGSVAYKLRLLDGSVVHHVFHVSQLKAYTPDYSPVHSTLLDIPALDVLEVAPEKIIDHRLVKKGNVAITQVPVQWSGLPESESTWEDYNVLKVKFPLAAAWGQAGSSVGGTVTTHPGGSDQGAA